MSNVEKIKLELQERFGPADAVEVSRDNKGRLNMKYPCPYKICQSKEHELKRHFMRKKHGWTEKEAALKTSFISRMFNYITHVDRYFVCKPKLFVKCNTFYDRIDQHLKNIHSNVSGTDEYVSLRNECISETAAIMNIIYDKIIFKFRPTKRFSIIQSQSIIDYQNEASDSKQKSSFSTITLSTKRTRAEVLLTENPLTTTARPNDFTKPNPDTEKMAIIKHKQKVIGKPLNITPSKRKKYNVLKMASKLKPSDKRNLRILTEHFQYFYSCGENILQDFTAWCNVTHSLTKSQQNANAVRSIWREIDNTLTTIPNKMRGGDSIDEFWFTPHLEEVKRQEKLRLDKRTPHLSAPTLLSKLGNISLF